MGWWLLGFFFLALGVYLVVRPVLKVRPKLKTFYAEADTFWGKVWAVAYKSATVAVSYIGVAIGFLLNQLETLAALVGDPGFQAEVSKVLGADTKTLGYVLIGFSVIVFASRMRSIVKAA